MGKTFDELGVALEMRDTIERIAKNVIERERPKPRYAIVDSVDTGLRKASVNYVNDQGSIRVSIGSFIPLVGQKVRVAGIGSDKYVDDIIGDVTVPPDTSIPMPPTLVGFSNDVINDSSTGIPQARLTVTWTAPADDTLGNPLDPSSIAYIVQWQINGSTKWNEGGSVAGVTGAVIFPVPTSTSVRVQVQAVLSNGQPSTWDISGYSTTGTTPSAGNTPSTPTVTPVMAGLKVTWDGKDSTNAAMPAAFDRCEVSYGTTNVYAASTLWDVFKSPAGGKTTITNLAYGTPYYVFFKIYFKGNVATGSTVSSTSYQILHVSGAVGGDITTFAADIITGGTVLATFIQLSGRLTTSSGGVQSGARTEFDGSGLRVYSSASTGFSSGQLLVADSSGLNVFGGTITGANFKTAASGKRIEIDSAFNDRIRFFTGDASEAAEGYIVVTNVGSFGTTGVMAISSPQFGSGAISSIFIAGESSSLANHGYILLNPDGGSGAGIVTLQGSLLVTQSVNIQGAAIICASLGSGSGTAVVWSSGGGLMRQTSSKRYKKDIKPLDVSSVYKVLDVDSVSFVSSVKGDSKETQWGFIAEQAEDSAKQFVHYDDEGRPDSIDYARFTVAHNLILKDLVKRIDALEAR